MSKYIPGHVTELAMAILGVLFVSISLVIPITYLKGTAKAKWIKQTRGIELEWYEAAFLEINVNSSDVVLKGVK